MNKIIGINEYLIKKDIKNITIHWLITDYCNFKCSYCLATERFLNKIVGKKELYKFIFSLKKIIKENKLKKIEIQLSGGEPLSNPIFIDIIISLFKINNINIIIITNGSLLKQNKEKLKILKKWKNKIEFLCSWHKTETNLYDFNENINILKNIGLNYKITYLIPTNITLKKLKEEINFLNKKHKNCDKLFRLIIEGKNIYTKYNKEILDYYDSFTSENFDKIRYKEDFIITYKNKEIKIKDRISLNKLFFKNSQNRKYKGWLCYNYINNYHIIRPDGVFLYGGCDIFRNTNLEKNFYESPSIIKKPVICTKSTCRCDSNLPTPKIAIKDSIKRIKKIDKILKEIKNIIKKRYNKKEIEIDKIRIIDNKISNKTLKINFKQKNNYIILSIEKALNTSKYDMIIKNYGINIKRIDVKNSFYIYKIFIIKNIIYILNLINQYNINL